MSHANRKVEMADSGGAVLKVDDETGMPYWALWGAGWKDGEDMDPGEPVSDAFYGDVEGFYPCDFEKWGDL